MKKLFVTCVLILGVALMVPSTASAQATGDVDVSITVNGFVILYYYDTIAITIPANVMAQALAGSDVTGGVADNGFTASAVSSTGTGVLTAENATAPTSSDPSTTAVTLTIQNAWAIRGLVASGSTVTVSVGNLSDLTSGASGTIAVTSGACSGTCTGLTPTFGTPLSGGVELGLDFSAITAPDTFASAPTYTITAAIV
ncbi:MAG: hypothetical protein ACC742_07840 [Thermoanaerobaculales bacterium]